MREITSATPRKALSDAELTAPPSTTYLPAKIMAERFGIETIEKFARLAIDIDEKVKAGRADGDWSTMDSISVGTSIITHLPGFASGIGEIDEEVRNLSREEIAELRRIVEPSVSEGVADIFEAVLLSWTGGLKIAGKFLPNE